MIMIVLQRKNNTICSQTGPAVRKAVQGLKTAVFLEEAFFASTQLYKTTIWYN